jgi:hypothetical protein
MWYRKAVIKSKLISNFSSGVNYNKNVVLIPNIDNQMGQQGNTYGYTNNAHTIYNNPDCLFPNMNVIGGGNTIYQSMGLTRGNTMNNNMYSSNSMYTGNTGNTGNQYSSQDIFNNMGGNNSNSIGYNGTNNFGDINNMGNFNNGFNSGLNGPNTVKRNSFDNNVFSQKQNNMNFQTDGIPQSGNLGMNNGSLTGNFNNINNSNKFHSTNNITSTNNNTGGINKCQTMMNNNSNDIPGLDDIISNLQDGKQTSYYQRHHSSVEIKNNIDTFESPPALPIIMEIIGPKFINSQTTEIYQYNLKNKAWEKIMEDTIGYNIFNPFHRSTELPDGSLFRTGGEFNGLTLDTSSRVLNFKRVEEKASMKYSRKCHTSIYDQGNG